MIQTRPIIGFDLLPFLADFDGVVVLQIGEFHKFDFVVRLYAGLFGCAAGSNSIDDGEYLIGQAQS